MKLVNIVILIIFLSNCTSNSSQSEQRNVEVKQPLAIDVINLRSSDNTMIGVKIKITNTSGKDINSAEVTCIVKNDLGKTIDFMKRHVIKSTEGGLAKGDSTYFEYILNVNRNLFRNVKFKLEYISYR